MQRISLVVLACLVAAAAGIADAQTSISLQADRGEVPAGMTWPLGAGIPLKPGQVRSTTGLGMRAANGTLLPAAFEARSTWPDGSIQWLWTDFQGPMGPSYTLLNTGQRGALPRGVTVSNSTSALVIDTGVMRVSWNKAWASPTQVLVGAGQIGAGDGQGLYVIDQAGAVATLGGAGAGLSWRVETTNAMRAVVRVEGAYTTAAGAPLARAVVRYHLYWNQPFIKVDHSFIVTRDNEQTAFREVAVRMPLLNRGTAVSRVGRADGAPIATTVSSSVDAWIFQRSYPHYDDRTLRYEAGSNTRVAVTGGEAEGWCDVNNGAGGVVIAVRDFAEQFPIELHANSSGVTAKLWSSRGGVRLDYKPSTLVDSIWGQTWASFAPTSPSNPWTYSQLRGYNPSPVGVAKTHELLVGYYTGAFNGTRTARWSKATDTPPIVMPNPRWTVRVHPRLFPPMAAASESGTTYAPIERLITAWYDEHTAAQKVFPYTGWYDWGKMPDLRYEKASNGRVYAQFTRLAYDNAYHVVRGMMLQWARSGDRRFFDAVHRQNLQLADTQIVHAGGGKDRKALGRFTENGAQNHPVYWSGSGIFYGLSSREPMWGMIMEYLFQDTRWLKDNVDLVAANLIPYLRSLQGTMTVSSPVASRTTAVYNAFRCEPFAGLAMLTSLSMVNRDPAIANFARLTFYTATDPADPGGIDREYFARCTGGSLYKPDRKALATVAYFDWTGDARARQIMPLIARAAAADKSQPFMYQNASGAYLARAYRTSGASDLLTRIRTQVTQAQQIAGAYHNLAASQRGVNHFLAAMHNTGHMDLNHYRYAFRGLPALNGQTAILDFSSSCNAPFLLGLPTAIWAMQGFPN